MNEFVMALEALKVASTVLPSLFRAVAAVIGWITGPDHSLNAGISTLSTVVGFAEEALIGVMALEFNTDDPVANKIGQWQSAYRTVRDRSAAAGFNIDPAAIHTALDLASHSVNFDTPLDQLTPKN